MSTGNPPEAPRDETLCLVRSAEEFSMRAVLVSYVMAGHRREYVELFSRYFAGRDIPTVVVDNWRATLVSEAPVLFLMIEEDAYGFAKAAVLRSLRGRRTAGLLFRAVECARPRTARTRLKGYVMGALKRWPGVSTLSILPFDVEPAIARVATDWLHDPQLWDIDGPEPVVESELALEIVATANGRRLLIALGAQNEEKGFHEFVDLWLSSEILRREFLFVAAGKVGDGAAAHAAAFQSAGGFLRAGFISDEDMTALYRSADLMWSCYAPHYNQASGIFGRAVQRGVPAVVRKGSYIEAQAALLQFPVLTMPWNDREAAAKQLLAWCPPDAAHSEELPLTMRKRSLKILDRALGMDRP